MNAVLFWLLWLAGVYVLGGLLYLLWLYAVSQSSNRPGP